MDSKQQGIVLALILAIITVLTIFLFAQTGITENHFLTLNIIPLAKILLGLNFWVFVIFSAIPIALVLFIGKNFDYSQSAIFAGGGMLIGGFGGMFLFGQTLLVIPIIFVVISLPLAIRFEKAKEKELKMMPELRAGIGAAGKITLAFSIGVLALLLLSAYPLRTNFESTFGEELVGITIGDSQSLKSTVSNTIGQVIVETQRQTVEQITALPQYTKLRGKEDIDVITFVATMDALQSQVNSTAYKETVVEQVNKGGDSVDLIKTIENTLPLSKVSQYAWIMYSLSGFILSLMIGSIIVKNLAGFFYALIVTLGGKKISKKASSEENPSY